MEYEHIIFQQKPISSEQPFFKVLEWKKRKGEANDEKKKKKNDKERIAAVGTVLKGNFKGSSFKAMIVKDKAQASGKAIKYDDKLYPSMTAAAVAITKQSTNGWRFWKF